MSQSLDEVLAEMETWLVETLAEVQGHRFDRKPLPPYDLHWPKDGGCTPCPTGCQCNDPVGRPLHEVLLEDTDA